MSTAMHEWPQRHRISVEHFYRMAEAGLFEADERVELVDGEIIDMPPHASRHAGTIDQLARLLTSSLDARAIVRQQLPLTLGEYSEPVPDIAVVHWIVDVRARQVHRYSSPAEGRYASETSSSLTRIALGAAGTEIDLSTLAIAHVD
jgi:Uma2 family endonuclease